jgi:[ribosomal protein S5]-alanine N-acetyltransferase
MLLSFPIVTERLILEQFSEIDNESYFTLVNDEDYIKYLGCPLTRSQANKQLSRTIGEYKIKQETGALMACENSSNNLVGLCGLMEDSSGEGLGIIYFVLPQFRRKGYATEMAKKMMDLTFDILKHEILLARVSQENTNSICLLEKLGMSYYKSVPNGWDNQKDCLYRLLRNPALV